MRIALDIVPPSSTGQSGKRLGVINGHAMMFETKQSKSVKGMFYALLQPFKPKEMLSGALRVSYWFFYPYNTSVKTSIRKQGLIIPKMTKPDYDNLPKQLQDIMTALQFWKDDSIISNGEVKKRFAPKGKIVINISTDTIDEIDYEEYNKNTL